MSEGRARGNHWSDSRVQASMGSRGRSPGRTLGVAGVLMTRVLMTRLEMTRVVIACVVVAPVLLVAACADSGSGGNGGGSGPTTTSPTATTSPAATGSAGTTGPATTTGPTGTAGPTGTTSEAPEDLPSPSAGRAKGGRTVTVSGTLAQGVEANCVLLGNYLLLGGPRQDLRPGRTVTVTGRLVQGIVTTCQQGTPLQVVRVVPAK